MVRPTRSLRTGRLSARARLIAVAVASCYASAPAWALDGANLTAVVGSYTASQSGNVLTLTTSTDRTLAEARERFNILANEQLRVLQPSSSSLFLLRVLPSQSGVLERSVIDGSIYSNGQFWLQNAAGALIGRGAVIDTAGFLATNMAVRLEDFMAARLTSLQNIGGSGGIVNQGEIKTSSGGTVYLIGDNVANEGVITTPGGETILAAGQTVNLIDTGTPGVKVEITGTEGNATNLGEIVAAAGRIGMAGVIVKNSGTLNASSVVSDGGRIFLKASKDTYVDGAGRIVATGTKGGNVEVLGERVALMDQAQIDVSGTNGGGTVLVGGDYQGKNPDVQNATVTYFGAGVGIKADATDDGDGGKVIVWADDTTRAYGTISARGGANGGNGGFVEVSGKHYLMYRATTDLRAPKGSDGSLLLDPDSVTIVANDTTYGDETCSPCTSGNDSILTSANPGTAPVTIGWNTIQSALSYGAVTITTTNGDIDVAGAPGTHDITLTHSDSWGSWSSTYYGAGYNSSNNLTLLANHAVNVNTWFGNYGSGAITILAGWDPGTGTSAPALYGGFTAGQSINIGSGGGIATKGALTLKAVDSINIAAGGNSAGIDANTALVSLLANKILVTGGGSTNARAFIRSNGSQSFTVGTFDSSGGVYLQGGSGAQYGNGADIALYGTSGTQSFTIGNGAKVELRGGVATGLTTGYSGECSVAPGCTDSGADIRNNGNGGQSFTFSNGGTLAIYGGSGGNGNDASIENRGTGTQVITASSGTLNIGIYGGSSGGATAIYGGKVISFDNSAGIESDVGSQTINAASLYLSGGSADYGGAYLSAPTQNITVSGALTLVGGSGTAPGAYDAYGDEIWYNPAVIGNDSANTVNLTVGSLTMTGGSSSTFGGSSAMIGAYRAATNVTVNSYGGITFSANPGAEKIGSFGGYGGSVTLRSGLGGTGTMALNSAEIGTGTTGTVTLVADGTGAEITQSATGSIKTGTLNASTVTAIGSINLAGLNWVNSVLLSAYNAVTYNSVTSFTATSVTSTYGAATLTATSGMVAGVPSNITLGSVSAGYGATIHAGGAIYESNGAGNTDITAGYGGVTLYSNYGGLGGSSLAISADIATSGPVSSRVYNLGGSGNGGIRIYNTTATAPSTVWLQDDSAFNSGVSYFNTGSLTSTATYSLSAMYGGYVKLGSGGNLTYPAGSFGTSGLVELYAAGNLLVSGALSQPTGNLSLTAGGTINVQNNVLATVGNIALRATSLAAYGAAITAANSASTVTGEFAGDMRLNDGSSLSGGTVNLKFTGANSTLYLNTTALESPSYIRAATTGSVNLDFTARSGDGVVIDGVRTTTSVAYGSGIFIGSQSTPAVAGATNFKVTYTGLVPAAVTGDVINSIAGATTSTTTTPSTTTQLASIPPPTTTSGGTSLTSLGSATVGGGTGQFGGSESTTSSSGATTSTSSTSTSGSGTSATGGDSSQTTTSSTGEGSTAAAGEENGKQDEQKDEARKADSDSGGKKDDKSQQKPVGKCSA